MIQRKFKRALALIFSMAALEYSCFAQGFPSGIAGDIQALKQGQEAIRKELQEIINLPSGLFINIYTKPQ
jgi:hypothetical protein